MAFRTGQPMNVAEVESTADPRASADGLKSLYHLPLSSRERVLGVLTLASAAENAFAEGDAAFLAQVANQIALAVENAIAYGEIASLKDKLAQEVIYLQDEIRTELKFEESSAIATLLDTCLRNSKPWRPRFHCAHLRRDRHRQRTHRPGNPQT